MNKIIIFLVFIFSMNQCLALRCHGKLVYEGDSQETVRKKCGEPNTAEVLSTSQALYNSEGIQYGTVPFLTEVWTYQFTPQDFVYSVFFTEKEVTSITANRRQ